MKISEIIQNNALKILTIVIVGLGVFVAAMIYYISQSETSQVLANDSTDFSEIAECFANSDNGDLNRCYDDFVEVFSEGRTIKEVLAAMDVAREQDIAIENSCHPMAHAIGRLSFQRYGNVGDAFQACDFSCHSGCYHGVMERLFFTNDELVEGTQHLSLAALENRIPGICDADKFKNPTQSIIFQCLHGVGHAILYSLDYELIDSLKACDLLSTNYEQTSCYGGVVMENITAFERDKRWIKNDDPLYPCNTLDKKYQYSCYQMQTSIMLEIGIPYEDQGEACLEAGIGNVEACHVSVGRDLSNFVRSGDAEYVARLCQQDVGGNYVRNCVQGAIYALIDNTWDASYAYELCNSLDEVNQVNCYQDSNNYLNTYDFTVSTKQDECRQYARENYQMCVDATGNY